VEPDLRDLMRSLKATRWQTFLKLELPAALPILLGGLKVGATLSVIGAVVGEFVGADRGLVHRFGASMTPRSCSSPSPPSSSSP
jgi:NitT/TauT family transport system permease protein